MSLISHFTSSEVLEVLQEEQSSAFGIACDRKMPKSAEFCIKLTGPFLIPKLFFICDNLQARPRLLPPTTQFTGVSFKPQTDGSWSKPFL